ncbi:MAG: hypothetical protein U0Y96_15195 [Candidatus Kapaibacterium sp.]|nr:hypothetical protein [Bacteroidota bacterium]
MDTDTYIIRHCKKCKHRQRYDYPKREVAFGLHDDDPFLCSKCNYDSSDYGEVHCNKLDDDILSEWIINPDVYLLEQDEELFLADINYLDLLLKYLDDKKALPAKKIILLEALCVIVYDIIKDDKDKEHLNRLKDELLKRKQLLHDFKDSIMAYLTDVVYPFLGLK